MTNEVVGAATCGSIFLVPDGKRSHKCPNCGKRFGTTDDEQWAYKHRGVILCSWRCLREFREKGRDKRYRADLKTLQKREKEVIMCIEKGITLSEYAADIGVATQSLYSAAARLRNAGYIDYEPHQLKKAVIMQKYYEKFGGDENAHGNRDQRSL